LLFNAADSSTPAGFTTIARLIAGQELLSKLEAAGELRQIRVIRVGAEAKAFVGEGQQKK
jgi:hypothetical protein